MLGFIRCPKWRRNLTWTDLAWERCVHPCLKQLPVMTAWSVSFNWYWLSLSRFMYRIRNSRSVRCTLSVGENRFVSRELVPTSRLAHFSRSDATSAMHDFPLRGLVGNILLKFHLIENYGFYVWIFTHKARGAQQGNATLDWRENAVLFARLYLIPFYPAGHFQFGLALDLFVHEHVCCMIFRWIGVCHCTSIHVQLSFYFPQNFQQPTMLCSTCGDHTSGCGPTDIRVFVSALLENNAL